MYTRKRRGVDDEGDSIAAAAGDLVEALWYNNKFYPATIAQVYEGNDILLSIYYIHGIMTLGLPTLGLTTLRLQTLGLPTLGLPRQFVYRHLVNMSTCHYTCRLLIRISCTRVNYCIDSLMSSIVKNASDGSEIYFHILSGRPA